MGYSAERVANGHILVVFLVGTLVLEEPHGINSIQLLKGGSVKSLLEKRYVAVDYMLSV